MEFITSITGKSPSTTGAGSEGALTKGPFNALPPIYDLNAALVAYLATMQPAFITAAGYVGPKFRVDHDISLLVPEIWCRMRPEEANPQWLLENGFLEKMEDFEYDGKTVKASILGSRITAKFVRIFFGRVFNSPETVFEDAMLKPELQDMETFVDGMETVILAHKVAAQNYFEDGSIEQACLPLKALLHIMVEGHYEGKDLQDPEIRALFTRESMLQSDWYKARLQSQQEADTASWQRHVEYLEQFLARPTHANVAQRLGIDSRLAAARESLSTASAPEYVESLIGTLGRQPF